MAQRLSRYLISPPARCRHAADGWHAVLRIGAVDHRVWSKAPLVVGAHYVAELPLDGDFDERAYAADGYGAQ